MIQWVLSRKWLPEIIFGAFALVLAASDAAVQGVNALVAAVPIALSVFFFRKFSYLAALLIFLGSVLEVLLAFLPLVSGLAAAGALFLCAAFGLRRWGLAALVASAASGLLVAWNGALNTSLVTDLYGVQVYNQSGRWWAFLLAGTSVVGVNGFAWLAGAYWVERSNQRATTQERDYVQAQNLRTRLDLAEQNARFGIARDLNALVLQRVSGLLALTDGARYASKVDSEVAVRTLDRLAILVRETHLEMRRLFDMLNKSVLVAVAPPGIDDLDFLAAQYRELGYPTTLTHRGKRVQVSEGAALNIYRIAFESLNNIKANAPEGTAIDIDFNWSETGLQVLIKDNGLEVQTKAKLNLGEAESEAGYDAEDDLSALTNAVTGPGITGMQERAQLFGGNIEAKIVPGIGFTVNLIFPSLEDISARQD